MPIAKALGCYLRTSVYRIQCFIHSVFVLGTFTSQSDVWAFGVTLWEIFTFARETPYEMMSDQQVIENACSVVAKEQKSFRCLPRPDACSNHVYRLLLNCWKRSPKERPSFNEIHWFFKRLVNSTEESI